MTAPLIELANSLAILKVLNARMGPSESLTMYFTTAPVANPADLGHWNERQRMQPL